MPIEPAAASFALRVAPTLFPLIATSQCTQTASLVTAGLLLVVRCPGWWGCNRAGAPPLLTVTYYKSVSKTLNQFLQTKGDSHMALRCIVEGSVCSKTTSEDLL